MKNFEEVLSACPLFEGVEHMGELLGCLGGEVRAFHRGQTILAAGEPALQLGVVLQGTVQVVRDDYLGNRSMMAKLGQGDLFAEAFACAQAKAMPVSVMALDDARVLLVRAQRLMQPCEKACGFHNRIIFNLMKILATKNMLCNQKIEVTSKRTTREKLLTYLDMQAQRSGSRAFTIPFSRQELADYLEVDRSGLSAEISRLRAEGVLESERSWFRLLE